jgi:cell wall-associated NlpC family hydrolase
MGIEVPVYTEMYADTKDRAIGPLISGELDAFWQPVEKPQFGDLIVLRMRGLPFHVGMALDNRHMIHIERGVDSAIENYTGMKWRKRVLGYYRLKQ